MITQIREDPMKGTSRPPSELPFRPTSYSQPFAIPYIHPFTTRQERKLCSPESSAPTTCPSAAFVSSCFTAHIQTQSYVLPSEPSPTCSPSYASSEASSLFSPRAQTHPHIHSPFPSHHSYASYPSPYPSYPPSRSPSTFHLRFTHTRNRSASSLSSSCSTSSSSSSFSSSSSSSTFSSRTRPRTPKPNTLTRDYLFHLRSKPSEAFSRRQPALMDEQDEWEEWGRGMCGVLEPRIVGPGWGGWSVSGVEEVLSGGW